MGDIVSILHARWQRVDEGAWLLTLDGDVMGCVIGGQWALQLPQVTLSGEREDAEAAKKVVEEELHEWCRSSTVRFRAERNATGRGKDARGHRSGRR